MRDTYQSVPFLRCYDEAVPKFSVSAITPFDANGIASKNVE